MAESILFNTPNPVWGERIHYLYNEGNEYDDLTGGWIESTYMGSRGIFTKNTDHLRIEHSANGSQTIRTNNKIDLTGYTNLCALVSSSQNNYSTIPTIITLNGDDLSGVVDIGVKVGEPAVVKKRVISFNGEYYIKFGFYYGSYVNIYKIWLE